MNVNCMTLFISLAVSFIVLFQDKVYKINKVTISSFIQVVIVVFQNLVQECGDQSRNDQEAV